MNGREEETRAEEDQRGKKCEDNCSNGEMNRCRQERE